MWGKGKGEEEEGGKNPEERGTEETKRRKKERRENMVLHRFGYDLTFNSIGKEHWTIVGISYMVEAFRGMKVT